jgi:hypothetical protein
VRTREDTTSSAIEHWRTRKEPPGYGRTRRCPGSGPCVGTKHGAAWVLTAKLTAIPSNVGNR